VTPSRAPRNIVLLSDGTGNSSAKLMKTNVWRMYEAVELTTGDQLALYDNGVGTSSFKPAAVLGGGLGWGLKRNVRTLYTFACLNYRPGDRIYAFGFSRGAFTIRVLIGLMNDQGLITGVTGRELERRAKWAYRAYRKRFNPTKGLVTPMRAIRDRALRALERGEPYRPNLANKPKVGFVGLWDTVDAYGLPIDEMTRGWDKWVWPLSMTDNSHPEIVEKLCHAIALDDERHTFHPVLLSESSEPICSHTDEERLTQVWFAGVHSNVGGGYPDDSLSYVSLRWMADEARKKGLRLHPHALNEWTARADPNGPVFDPRSGLGSYYRYNPRSVKKLIDDRFAKVHVPRAKIHESVFSRIAVGRDGYAPIVLPESYAVVRAGGEIVDSDRCLEHATQSSSRCADQERVWNLVWQRRIVYFATVGVTLLLFARPFLFDPEAGGVLALRSNGLSGAIGLLRTFLPEMAEPWVEFYQNRPLQLLVLAALITIFMYRSSRLRQAIADDMRQIWSGTVALPRTKVRPSEPPHDWAYRLRSSRPYREAFNALTRHVLPFVFGFGCLAALLLIAAGTVNRIAFAAAGASGWICSSQSPRAAWDGTPRTIDLPSNTLCLPTGLELQKGQRYRVEILLPDNDAIPWDERWRDKGTQVDTPAGFSSGRHPIFVASLPFRRVLTARWFVPMVRVGDHLAEYHRLNQIEEVPTSAADASLPSQQRRTQVRGFAEFTPTFTGPMFLFVNDAVLPFRWEALYSNNRGSAKVTITAIEGDPVE
jgi:uncharacterized protein (DUF2235 family)